MLPDKEPELKRLLRTLDGIGVDFVNLNELEFSETNEDHLHDRGYELDPQNGWGVRGSRALAQRLVQDSRLAVPIHYCSSRFKDGVQLRQRLLRRAERTAPHFRRADPGRYGRARDRGINPRPRPAEMGRGRGARAGVGPDDYRLDVARRRIELAPGRLRRAARALPWPAFEVEVYPTEDALEVERMPLNRAAMSRAGVAVGST